MKHTLKRIAKISFIAVAIFVLIAGLVFAEFFFGVALPEYRVSAPISLPPLSGRYPVGRRFLEWVDESRSDPVRKSANRELVVSVWYPAQTTDADQTGMYLPGVLGLETARFQQMLLRVRVQSFWSALLRNPLPRDTFFGIKTHVVDNAAISSENSTFPVLLFSPGFSAVPSEYTALLEDVASHGYVVVAIYPTDFVPVVVFKDGRSVYASPWNRSLYNLEKDYSIWVRDMLSVLNRVSHENSDPQSPLFARLEMARVGAFGHSFGGAAAAGACHSDSRIGAGLNLDGEPQGDRSAWRLRQPFMLVESDGRNYKDGPWQDFYEGLSIGYRVVIKGSTHHAFTDETMFPLPENQRKRALVGNIPGSRMVRMTSSLICAFFDIYLQNRPAALLKDVSARFSEITIQTSGVRDKQ